MCILYTKEVNMAKRVSITIPNDLHEKAEFYRGKINISNICTRALEKELNEIKEYAIKAKHRFYILTPDEACDLAYDIGKKWAAEKATLAELAFVCEFNNNAFFNDFNKNYPDVVKDAIFEMLMENYDYAELYNKYDFVYDYFMANASFIDEDILAGFVGEDGEELYGDYARDYEFEIINSFIDGARLIWDEIREPALVRMLGKETMSELKKVLENKIVKDITATAVRKVLRINDTNTDTHKG